LEGTWRLERDSANIERYLVNACENYNYYGYPPDPCYLVLSKNDVQLCDYSCFNLFVITAGKKWTNAKDGQIYITNRNSSGNGISPNVTPGLKVEYYFDYKLDGGIL